MIKINFKNLMIGEVVEILFTFNRLTLPIILHVGDVFPIRKQDI